MSVPVLWHFAISHYNEKVRWALDYKKIDHRKKQLLLSYPIRNYLKTGQLQTPILFHNGKTILDSTAIIAYLEREFPELPLYPKDPEQRKKALELEEFFDEELGAHVRTFLVNGLFEHSPQATADAFCVGASPWHNRTLRLFFRGFVPYYCWRHNINQQSIVLGREKVVKAVEKLEQELDGKQYLVGDSFSVADLTAAALFYPLAIPDEYPYQFSPLAKQVIQELTEPFQQSKIISWITQIYRLHRECNTMEYVSYGVNT